VGLGLLLIMTAVLKWQWFGGSHSSTPLDVAPILEWLAIQFEVLLGRALLIGLTPRLTWTLRIGVLSALGDTNLVKVAQGRSRFGCLRVVEVPPLVILLVDVVFLGLHWGARPSVSPSTQEKYITLRFIALGLAGLMVDFLIDAATITREAGIRVSTLFSR
jgi:hypothetical protein